MTDSTSSPSPECEFWLVRHGETDWNKAGRWQGHANVPLSSRGQEQAQALADRWSRDPDAQGLGPLFCSDLDRCIETAAPLGRLRRGEDETTARSAPSCGRGAASSADRTSRSPRQIGFHDPSWFVRSSSSRARTWAERWASSGLHRRPVREGALRPRRPSWSARSVAIPGVSGMLREGLAGSRRRG